METKTEAPAGTRSTPYFWFQGESVLELYERLSIIGPAVARLEVHTHGNRAYLEVIGDGYDGPPINESHICPPDCGT